jgi:AcrR family transcriptional regulator
MSQLLNPDRPMRADARRNRAAILKAARELFASEEHEVQIDDIARRAGVGVGTVYRHFPDKEALMGELVRERFGLFNEHLGAALADEQATPFDALAGALRANAASVAEDAATRFAFMSGGERVFAYAASEMDEFMRLSSQLVDRAQVAGEVTAEFRAEDIPMVMCGVCAAIDKRKAGWDWRRHLELILRGMRTRIDG